MALSTLRELSKLSELSKLDKEFISPTITKYVEMMKRHGLLGEDIWHLFGSSQEGTTTCRAFNILYCTSLSRTTLQLDTLFELFKFDSSALGNHLVKSDAGIYHLRNSDDVMQCIHGQHTIHTQLRELLGKATESTSAKFGRSEKDTRNQISPDLCSKLMKDNCRNMFDEAEKLLQTYGNVIDVLKDIEWKFDQKSHGSVVVNEAEKLLQTYGNVINILKDMEWKFDQKSHGSAVVNELKVFLKVMPTILMFGLSIDVVPCAVLSFWPDDLTDFTTRNRKWPPDDVIAECSGKLVYLIPQWSNNEVKNDWQLSFVQQEQLLEDKMTDDMKFTFYLFKVLFYTLFKKKQVRVGDHVEFLSSYVAKTTMLWACEEKLPNTWGPDNLEQNLKFLVEKLYQYLETGTLPNYFVPQMNLLEKTSKELLAAVIKYVKGTSVRKNPMEWLPIEKDIKEVLMIHKYAFGKMAARYRDIEQMLQIRQLGQMFLSSVNMPQQIKPQVKAEEFHETQDDLD